MTTYRQLARNHDFTILWVGETISELGSTMSLFVFPLVGYHLTGSTAIAAVLEAAALLGLCGTLLPAGVLADRFDRRALMLGASASGAALYGSLAVAGALHALTVPHLAAVALLGGVCTGLYQPAQSGAVRAVVSTEDLPTALSQNQARQHLASLVGGPLGGLLYAVRAWAPFAVDALTSCVSCVTLSRIRTDLSPRPATAERPRLRAQLTGGFHFIWARPFFRVLMAWSASANLLVNAIFFVVMLRLVQDGFPAAQIGLVSTAAGLGGILGALVAPYLIDRARTGWLTVAVAWMVALPLVPLIWSSSPWTAAASVGVLMLLTPAGNAGIGAYRTALTPDDLQGRVASTSQFLAMSVMPLSPLLGGWALGALGVRSAVVLLIGLTVAVALVPTLSRSIREVPRPAEWRSRLEPAGGRRPEPARV